MKPPPSGSKPPGNLSAGYLADMEAAFVGNLMDYCVVSGAIPPVRAGCFWRDCEGGILGLRSTTVVEDDHGERYPALERVISHLRAYAGEVVTTEGVGDLLAAGEATRACSRFYYDKPDKNYISVREAASIAGRAVVTIYKWMESGWIEAIQDANGDVIVEAGSVESAAIALPLAKKIKAKKAA